MAVAAEAPPITSVDELNTAATILETLVLHLDPYSLQTSELVAASEAFARISRMGEAGTLLLAPVIDHQGAYRKGGYKNTAEMLAHQNGTSLGAAHGKVNTGKKLRAKPKSADALRKGKLSGAQAGLLGDAHPDDEEKLLDEAQHGFGRLRDAAEDAKAARTSEEDAMERYRRVHRERNYRKWTKDGAFCFAGSITLDRGAAWMASVEDERQRLYEEARREGRMEDPSAYLIDAIINVSTGNAGPRPQRPKASMHLRADAAAILRGYLEQDEKCEIAGYGPIPITVARWLLQDADVSGAVFDGDDVRAITSHSRVIPDKLRRALFERDKCCQVPFCRQTQGLQIDHIDDFAKGGPTELGNLDLKCAGHHFLKTIFGWRLTGRPGDKDRQWLPPPNLE
ncbi:MAG: HNH endonuclease signature motif containing protein [Acidimicrobiales bacterium]|nr:HNH endonuclease signature motif containing protein [Acidimicrobiales bacterium]